MQPFEFMSCLRTLSSSARLCKQTLRNAKGKSPSSQAWLRRQISDPYVKRAGQENYRCRSAFKLIEMNDKYGFLQPGCVVIDCGAAPGSWTQVAVSEVNSLVTPDRNNSPGVVIAVDNHHMLPVPGAVILQQMDFTKPETQNKILKVLNGRKVDVVLSDMAPRCSGIHSMDHELIINLCFSVLTFSSKVLKQGGHMVCKLWQGGEQKRLENSVHKLFDSSKILKPKSSRTNSSEVYLFGRHLNKY